MNKFVYMLMLLVVFMSACSKEERKLELFSPEAFAFKLEEGWELNASVQVKGVSLRGENGGYSARLSYYVDAVTPAGEKLEEIYSDIVNKESADEFNEMTIELQVEFDQSYLAGEYKLIFYVTDDYLQQEVSIEKTFELTAE
ncbi:MAG: hypothetical protein A2V66_01525 [Ignavibacteria bacterium RBG_13_36_8]|nr:MAG: hypothetical protein A2V66_01525 [Ignavibacteria bacterium RBG_13_36_8]